MSKRNRGYDIIRKDDCCFSVGFSVSSDISYKATFFSDYFRTCFSYKQLMMLYRVNRTELQKIINRVIKEFVFEEWDIYLDSCLLKTTRLKQFQACLKISTDEVMRRKGFLKSIGVEFIYHHITKNSPAPPSNDKECKAIDMFQYINYGKDPYSFNYELLVKNLVEGNCDIKCWLGQVPNEWSKRFKTSLRSYAKDHTKKASILKSRLIDWKRELDQYYKYEIIRLTKLEKLTRIFEGMNKNEN